MSEPKSRKTAPEITEEVDRELSNSPDKGQPNNSSVSFNMAAPVPPHQSEPQSFHDFVDYSKLQFGQKLIGWCIALVVALSLVSYFWNGADPNGNGLGTAIELLKLVTTTALGFVFAKTQITTQQSQKDRNGK